MITLADLRPQAIDFSPVHPTYGVLPVKLKIQGQTAPAVKRKQLAATSQLRKLETADTTDDFVKVMMNMDEGTAEVAAAAVVGWDNDELMGGEYTPGYILSLLKQNDFAWLRRQINELVSREAAFFRAGPSADVGPTEAADSTGSAGQERSHGADEVQPG